MAIFQHTNDHEMHPFKKAKSYFVLFSICRNFVRKVVFFLLMLMSKEMWILNVELVRI